jgi:hypothetical protein
MAGQEGRKQIHCQPNCAHVTNANFATRVRSQYTTLIIGAFHTDVSGPKKIILFFSEANLRAETLDMNQHEGNKVCVSSGDEETPFHKIAEAIVTMSRVSVCAVLLFALKVLAKK